MAEVRAHKHIRRDSTWSFYHHCGS